MDRNQSNSVVPNSVLENLHCVICTKYLSVFPIHFSSSLGAICGRCPVDNLSDVFRNTIYETFVQDFKFPCSNVTYGCPEYIIPSQIADHELNCKYRHVRCPSSEHLKCDWLGPCTQLQDHYENLHPIFLMKQLDFEVNFINTFDENYLLLYGDELFIFKRKADANIKILNCSVMYIGWNAKPIDFNYRIKLTNRSDNAEKIFNKQPTNALNQNITQIIADDVNRCLNNPSVIVGNIEITIKDGEEPANVKPQKPNVCNEMLDTIECPVCFEYMVPPIFQCLGGHSICGNCKETVSQCPSCREGIKETRNFILEKMINYLQYPCKNWENGCTVISEAASIKNHEKLCEFGSYECPLKDYVACNFKSKLSDLNGHLRKQHHENILELDTIHIPLDEGILDDEDAFILKYLQKLFILHFKIEKNSFWWAIQLIGSPENSKKYFCEIDIVDNASGKNRIYLKGPSAVLTSKDNAFKELPYFKLNFEQVEHFITDTFSFQVRVYKD